MTIFIPMVTVPISMGHNEKREGERWCMQEIACFITPHGFGHATRMIAVLESLQSIIPDLHPHVYSTVPKTLFAETLAHFSYHPLSCDIGLVQKDGLRADLPTTIKGLENFLPFKDALIRALAEQVQGCKLILCDIAPLGIAVAHEAGITSVLIENFTWDWIYKAYLAEYPQLQPAISYLSDQYRQADIHIRCQPCCGKTRGDFECGPIFRPIRTKRSTIRNRLNCKDKRLVLISMGGIDLKLPFVQELPASKDTFFILAGQKKTHHLRNNVLLLGRDSEYYHPDLINAADLVICKSGYSTIAECVQAGVPVATVGRSRFPESAVLEQFSITQLNGQPLEQREFLSGSWLRNPEHLPFRPRLTEPVVNGAESIAEYLFALLA